MKHYKLIILGGGSGGISMASRMRKHIPQGKIAIIEPSEFHYFQPFWTLVGGGIVTDVSTKKKMSCVIPEGAVWIQAKLEKIDGSQKLIELSNSEKISYDYLIVATGLELNWTKIKGLENNLGKNGVSSVYQFDTAPKTFDMLNNLTQGNAIFTLPPMPIKCAGAPQKIMYLAEEIFRKNGVRKNINVIWASNSPAMFGIPYYAEPLAKIAAKKGIKTQFQHRLIEIKASEKMAIFEVTEGQKTRIQEIQYDFIHIVPPQSAHQIIEKSGLAWEAGHPQFGWLKCDPFTLQHLTYKNIFGVGDVTGVPNAKTGAAIRKQAPIVEKNLVALMNNRPLTEKYDGYSSCPLITDSHHVLLAEFGYDSKIMPSFPLDPRKERYIYWLLKRYILPKLYWWGMLKGRM